MRKLIILLACLSLTAMLLSGCSAARQAPPPQGAAAPADSGSQGPGQNGNQPTGGAAPAADPGKVSAAGSQPAQQPSPGTAPAANQNYSLEVGGIFPPSTLTGLNGGKVATRDLFAGNKVTLVNFWGTFCGPCISEMPELEALRQKYAGQGLGIAGIVIDPQKADTARSIAAQTGTNFPHLLDDGRYGSKIYAVPHTLLVDSQGKVLTSVTGRQSLIKFSRLVEPYLK